MTFVALGSLGVEVYGLIQQSLGLKETKEGIEM